jgi:YHS domain-containing protein
LVKDVVCGMDVSEDSPYKIEYKGRHTTSVANTA